MAIKRIGNGVRCADESGASLDGVSSSYTPTQCSWVGVI